MGERCQILHTVNLFDIDLDLADVMPVAEVTAKLVKPPDDTSRNRARGM